ncbi:D-alanyl-D-alanine carboxypeptidase [Streptomyces sp. NPDC091280]|uniref:D-alanyl-D-alanine carboxypeptidase n=1 Tax=Streptomyces sp. NPDC091280 TaxID=3365984 RepID=UPI0037FAB990
MAVAREATSTSSQRGGVDTATKIFSIREPRPEPEPEPAAAGTGGGAPGASGASGSGSGSGDDGSRKSDGADGTDERAEVDDVSAVGEDAEATGDSDAQNPSAKGGPAGDARLRAAVAAWVAGPDESDVSDESDESDDSDGSGASDAEEPAGADAGADAEDAVKAAESAETVLVATRPAKDRAEDDAETATEDGPQDAVPGTVEADDTSEADEPADARPEATGTASGDDTPDDTPEDAVRDAAEASQADEEPQDAAPDSPAAEPEDAAPTTPEDASDEPEDTTPGAATPEPQAADAADAPQAAPAPDDASRTGGAGGKTEAADGGAEAVDQPTDHPTTVFKALRPPKPEVDQPTTMLKAPSIPEAESKPEAPAERTSRFVALKPLDEPRTPAAPRPDAPRADATRPVAQVGPERTTQQPLPPKPPLDLLAELTNTPPPPQTPVRTAIRRVKIWTPLVVLLAIVFAVAQSLRPLPTPSLTLTADDSYTFDGSKTDLPWPSEGQGWMDVNGIGTMGNFGKQTPVAIGSVAKAMTAYIVLKDHPLKPGAEGEKITVDATAEKEGGYDKDGESTLNTVKAGDVLTEKQALSAIMIPSANNIARLLARWDAGSEAAFIKKMNDTAKALGMTNTTYTDASGLKESTVSTAEDQVKLGNQLVKIQALMDITRLPSWIDPSGHKWTNYNRLVPYNNSLGIKTGTTTAAGGNLLFAATKEVGGQTAVIVGAILGQHTAPIIDTVNAVSKTAMLAAQDAMKSAKILKKGDVVGYVDDQLGGHTPVVVTKDVAAVGWAGLKVKLSFASDAVPHTAKAGTKVGTLTVGDGSGGAVKVPVALEKDLAEPALTAKLTRLG